MLRADDLEVLAARAQAMIEAANGRGPAVSLRERAKIAKQHRLLGDLLQATENNLEVLQRLSGRTGDSTRRRVRVGEGSGRWVL